MGVIQVLKGKTDKKKSVSFALKASLIKDIERMAKAAKVSKSELAGALIETALSFEKPDKSKAYKDGYIEATKKQTISGKRKGSK